MDPAGFGAWPPPARRARTVPAIETTATCYRHPDRETGRACTRCGRPACADCLRDAPVGSHCLECIRAGQPRRRERMRRWNARTTLLVTKVVIALNAAVFVATVMFLLLLAFVVMGVRSRRAARRGRA
jgi:hypothetical protein